MCVCLYIRDRVENILAQTHQSSVQWNIKLDEEQENKEAWGTRFFNDTEILTYKFRSTKNVFKIIAQIYLVGQAKVNDLDARVRHWAIKQHDVLRLESKQKRDS